MNTLLSAILNFISPKIFLDLIRIGIKANKTLIYRALNVQIRVPQVHIR